MNRPTSNMTQKKREKPFESHSDPHCSITSKMTSYQRIEEHLKRKIDDSTVFLCAPSFLYKEFFSQPISESILEQMYIYYLAFFKWTSYFSVGINNIKVFGVSGRRLGAGEIEDGRVGCEEMILKR